MRRFIIGSFITIALVLSVASVSPPSAYAQTPPATVTTVTPPPTDKPTSSFTAAALNTAFGSVMSVLMSLFAWLLGIAMVTLDYSVYYTVVTMGDYIKKLDAIGITWRILRDISNILLIFGFLGVGISTILNSEWYGGGKKFLPKLLAAAVLLNFSLFITGAIIDTGNLFATQFYTQINGGIPAGASVPVSAAAVPTAVASAVNNEVISTKIMSQLGLQTLYNAAKAPGKEEIFQGDNIIFVGMMGILLFIVTAFVMFSLAFILITRFVALVFLIILSPIGFAGLAIPQLASTAKQWWDALIKQTITAPILLLLLYIALAVITDPSFLRFGTAGPDYLGFIQKTDGGFDLPQLASALLSFLVAMGLLLSVTYFSKKLGAFGGNFAMGAASKLSGATLVARGVGLGGRYTAGAIGSHFAKGLRNSAAGRTFVGRGIAGSLEKRVAGANFDVGNTGLSKALGGYGLDLGKGQKGGYKADFESRVKSYETAGGAIKGRAPTKEEVAAVAAATMKKQEAEKTHTEVKKEHETAAQEQSRLKAEVARLEKEKERNDKFMPKNPEIEQKLADARKNLETNTAGLSTATTKLAKAAEHLETVTNQEEVEKAKVKTSTSDKSPKEEYAGRLENKWGKIPFFGAAAAAAASRVKSNIGKSKEMRELEALLAKVKEKAGESEEKGGPEKKEEKK